MKGIVVEVVRKSNPYLTTIANRPIKQNYVRVRLPGGKVVGVNFSYGQVKGRLKDYRPGRRVTIQRVSNSCGSFWTVQGVQP